MVGGNGNIIAIAQREENLYQMTFTEVCEADAANFVCSRAGGGLMEPWHRRLGHLDLMSIYALQSMVRIMTLGKTSHHISTLVCKACMKGK